MTVALVSFGCLAKKNDARTETKQNLLLVTIDTVRADHLGAYGDARAETPNLDRLAREGVRFDQASSAVPLTLPSHATILSGLLPPHHGLRNNGAGKFPEANETLATRLQAAGYRTGAFVGAYVLDHRFGLNRGFETYDDEIPRDPDAPAALEAERPGSVVVDRALAWLGNPDERPFFAWVHLYDAHAPYAPPEPFRSRHADSPYDGEVASVDFQVGRILSWIDQHPGTATVVAVAADHGEALGEHGELTHGFLLYEPTLHVPLLLRGPRLSARRVVRTPVGLVDLAPTLAGLLGLRGAAGKLDGRDLSTSLLSGAEPAAADLYAETEYARVFGWSGLAAIRRRNLKFIESPHPELYDLARDGKEESNLLAAGSSRADLSARVAELRAGERAPEATAGPGRSEEAARLASLGYIAGSPAPAQPGGRGLRDPKEMVGTFRKFEEAHWDLVGGRLKAAREKLLAVVKEDPRNGVFLDSLAHAYRRLGDLPTAIDYYRKAVSLSPGDADTRYDLAVTLQEAGRTEEALSMIREALQKDSSRPEALDVLGIAYLAQRRPVQALEQFDRAAAIDPRSPRTQNNRGNVLRELKRFDEAEAAYRRAIELAPTYADPWNGLGALEVERGRSREAVACFERAIALSPEDHEARLNLGIALETEGDLASAAKAYRDFLQAARNDPRFSQQRAIAAQLIARLAQKESEKPQSERR